MPTSTSTETTALRELTRLVERASRELGDAGRPDAASGIVAAAWAAVRDEFPKEAARLTGLLHRINNPAKSSARSEPSVANAGIDLDVRRDPPARRHQLIFEAFHALDPGDGFVLVNDHDPKPLYYQFAAEYPDSFVWESLEEGPEVWRVYIGSWPPVTTTPVALPMGEVESIATMVLEGLRIRGFDTVTLTDPAAVAAWGRLQDTLRSGHVRHAEPADFGLVLAGIRRVADADGEAQE